jgi:hypothetical protein
MICRRLVAFGSLLITRIQGDLFFVVRLVGVVVMTRIYLHPRSFNFLKSTDLYVESTASKSPDALLDWLVHVLRAGFAYLPKSAAHSMANIF